MKITTPLNIVLAIAFLLFTFSIAQATPVSLGAASICTVLIVPGGSGNNLNINGGAAVNGNVCVSSGQQLNLGGGAKVGSTAGTDNVVSGIIYTDPNAAGIKLNGQNPASVVVKDLSQAVNDAFAANTAAAGLTPTQNFNDIDVGAGTFTINGNGGLNVINVSNDIKLHGSGILALSGGANDQFVLNITGTYTQSSTSNVVLQGGVSRSNVLWNFIGTGQGANIGGSGVTRGIFLSPFRDFNMTDMILFGQIIARGNLGIQSQALVVPEGGSTLALLGIGLIGILALRRKLASPRA